MCVSPVPSLPSLLDFCGHCHVSLSLSRPPPPLCPSHPVAVGLTRVCQSQRRLLLLTPKKGRHCLSSTPPPACLLPHLSSTSSPVSGTLSFSLSLSLSLTLVLLLARSPSLFPGRDRRSVLQLTEALQSYRGACPLHLFSVFFPQSLSRCIGKQISSLTCRIQ